MVHFLHQTRLGYYRDGYQAEPEPAGDDEESFLWITGSESEIEGELYPRIIYACNRMEVDGHDAGRDYAAAGMFSVEDNDSDEVVRPTRHVRNVVASDDEDDNGGGGAEVDPDHPRGTMAVFDEIAPVDAGNPSEFPLLL